MRDNIILERLLCLKLWESVNALTLQKLPQHISLWYSTSWILHYFFLSSFIRTEPLIIYLQKHKISTLSRILFKRLLIFPWGITYYGFKWLISADIWTLVITRETIIRPSLGKTELGVCGVTIWWSSSWFRLQEQKYFL